MAARNDLASASKGPCPQLSMWLRALSTSQNSPYSHAKQLNKADSLNKPIQAMRIVVTFVATCHLRCFQISGSFCFSPVTAPGFCNSTLNLPRLQGVITVPHGYYPW